METNGKTFYAIVVAIVACVIFGSLKTLCPSKYWKQKCWNDLLTNKQLCIPICKDGYFALPYMTECQPWLTCSDIEKNLKLKETLIQSVVKTIYIAEWDGLDVILSVLSSFEYEDDFRHNSEMLMSLGQNPYTVQLIGVCNHSIVTQYHKLGSALNTHYHLQHALYEHNKASTRFNLCISYASILAYLHNSPVGVRVMCDSNSLEKSLSQYLLTDDLQLVINDLDATPQVYSHENGGVVCGPRPLSGEFVAPEQLWPYNNLDYDPKLMPKYDEKTDIWKIPDICNWFLGNDSSADVIKFKLFEVHKKCKNIIPSNRPTSSFMLSEYKKLWNILFNKTLSTD